MGQIRKPGFLPLISWLRGGGVKDNNDVPGLDNREKDRPDGRNGGCLAELVAAKRTTDAALDVKWQQDNQAEVGKAEYRAVTVGWRRGMKMWIWEADAKREQLEQWERQTQFWVKDPTREIRINNSETKTGPNQTVRWKAALWVNHLLYLCKYGNKIQTFACNWYP